LSLPNAQATSPRDANTRESTGAGGESYYKEAGSSDHSGIQSHFVDVGVLGGGDNFMLAGEDENMANGGVEVEGMLEVPEPYRKLKGRMKGGRKKKDSGGSGGLGVGVQGGSGSGGGGGKKVGRRGGRGGRGGGSSGGGRLLPRI
jgi:hypothetical protein